MTCHALTSNCCVELKCTININLTVNYISVNSLKIRSQINSMGHMAHCNFVCSDVDGSHTYVIVKVSLACKSTHIVSKLVYLEDL